jgi:hypothetical protein
MEAKVEKTALLEMTETKKTDRKKNFRESSKIL